MWYYIILLLHGQMKCKNLKYRNVLKEIIQQKCSTIFEEARNMANDFDVLDGYKDLFIEQSKSILTDNNIQGRSQKKIVGDVVFKISV